MSTKLAMLLGALVAATVMFTSAYSAEMTWTDGELEVRIADVPCKQEIIQGVIPDEHHTDFRGGFAVFEGERRELCWAVPQPGIVFLLDDQGNYGSLPQEAFVAPGSAQPQGGWIILDPRRLIVI